jgi:hypothetical protein
MSKLTGISDMTVTFWLPEWFPPDRKEYRKSFKYPTGHAWAGQVERTEYHNSAVDNLFRLGNVDEVCHVPGHGWITFKIDPDKNMQKQIDDLRGKLERLLAQYKEAKAA